MEATQAQIDAAVLNIQDLGGPSDAAPEPASLCGAYTRPDLKAFAAFSLGTNGSIGDLASLVGAYPSVAAAQHVMGQVPATVPGCIGAATPFTVQTVGGTEYCDQSYEGYSPFVATAGVNHGVVHGAHSMRHDAGRGRTDPQLEYFDHQRAALRQHRVRDPGRQTLRGAPVTTIMPGGGIASRPLHLIIAADRSHSMVGARMQSLNFAVATMLPILREWEDRQEEATLLVRVLQFGTSVSWHVEHPTPLADMEWLPITVDKEEPYRTAMGEALTVLARTLDAWSHAP